MDERLNLTRMASAMVISLYLDGIAHSIASAMILEIFAKPSGDYGLLETSERNKCINITE